MALTKATLIDLNSNELVLDLDADTSITADTDDTIHFKIAGSDEITMTAGAIAPSTSDGNALGTTSLMFSDLFLASGSVVNFNNGDVTLTHASNTLVLAGGSLDINGQELILDADADTSITASTDDQIDFRIGGSDLITFTAGKIDLKNAGTASQILFYCESSNAHAQTLIGAPHSEAASNTLTLPGTGGNARLVSTTSTATLTNKTLTTPVIAEIDSGSTITLDATTDIVLDADGGDIFFKDGGTTFGSATNTSGNLIIKSGTTTAATFSGANVTLAGTVGSGNITSTGTVQGTTITATTAFVPDASDGAALGTTALEFSDLFLADAAVIALGADQDVTLTHVADTGILLNSTNVIQFNDASQNIGAPSATVLDINATDEIELNATLVDVNANLDVSGTTVSAGVLTANAGVVVDNITIDGTEIDLSSGDLTLDVAGDIVLDADGGNFKFSDGGTQILDIGNSSSDVIIKPVVDTKDLIFQQRDGTEVMRIEDGAYMSLAAMAVNPEATLTDGANVAWNVLTSPVAKVTLGGNRNLSAASGGVAGQFVSLLVIQDGTGSRTLTPNAVYEFTGDVAPTLTTTANKGDLFVFRYNGSKYLEVGRNLNLTLS